MFRRLNPDRTTCWWVQPTVWLRRAWPGYINMTTYTIQGLAEYTLYFFQLKAGDASGYDVNPYLPPPNATTLIARTYPTWLAQLCERDPFAGGCR